MFLALTPFSFLFASVYFLVLFFMLSISNFYFFWLYMEVSMLLFMGLSYTVFTHSFTQLMLYFLMQTLASFSMLVFYTLNLEFLLYFSLFLKLGMFPFMSWYLNVLYRFPSFILLLSMTLHKLPPLFLFFMIYSSEYSSFILVSILLSLMVGGFYMLSVLDLRYLLVVSSMANNGFLLMGLMSGSLSSFWFFYVLYSLNVLFILTILGNFVKPLVVEARFKKLLVLLVLGLLLNMAALPPLPMFLAKFQVLYDFFWLNPGSLYTLVALVLANVFMMASYCQLFMKYLTCFYSHSSNYLLF